ncbi:polysaccharide export protein [Synechococcus sp. CS-1330]|nr:polysaccharide export protein [Synechococcus sp. CS-1330]
MDLWVAVLGCSASLLACSLLATGLTASSVVVLPPAAKAVEASAGLVQAVPVSQEDAYVLGPGDGLQLRFFGATELSGPVEVLSDGNVSLPLLGPVRLTGLTLPQANQWLELIYKKQLLRPELQLSLVRPRPLRVALVGEVERPGLYTLTSSELSQTEAKVSISGLPTLVDAIQKAGGITPMANLREVTLQRRLPGEPLRYKRTSVDLLALVQQGDQLQNPILFDGDTIRIEAASEPVAEVIELASTTLSPDTISVNVIGEVLSPGTLPLPANTPLVQAVLAAGGPQTWRASKGNVELVRINRNGTATRQRFQLNLSQGASNTKNPPLRDGDTVVVNRSGLARASDAIGAVSTPLTGLVNILALVDLINKD